MALLSIILWGAFILILLLVIHMTLKFRSHAKFFKKNGIPYLGAGLHRVIKLFTGKTTMVDIEIDFYKEATSKGGLVGSSDVFGTRGLYVTDLELIKNIFVRDFDHFVNRRPLSTEQSNLYMKKMLFVMESEHWKGIRTKLSPTLTTGKIRKMFSIFKSSSNRMADYVKEQVGAADGGGDFDFNLAFPKYAMEVIASCAFGIESKCFEVPPNQMSTIEEMGKRFQFTFSPLLILKFILLSSLPKLANWLGVEVMDTVPQKYFADGIKQVIKRRRQTGERADDFLQLMLDAQQGLLKIDDDSKEVLNGTTEKNVLGDLSASEMQQITFDDDDVIANCLSFLIGAFDPTQSVLLFAVYQLALEQEVQEKVYKNVKSNIDAKDGDLSYEGLLSMTYLDMFLNETLRLFPPSSRTERLCTKDYRVPGTNTVIEKGSLVAIPIHSIHHDPKYFDNPESFEPERFSVDRKSSSNAFMPFGHGPRNCIGMRFALIQVKTAIAKLVHTFKFETCEKTTVPMEFGTNTNLKPKHGMWLRVTPRT